MNDKSVVILLGAVDSTVFVGFSVQAALETPAASAHAVAPTPTHKPALSRLERLPCFGCHNIEHFRKGKPKPLVQPGAAAGEPKPEFSHTLHQDEGVGHCHMCHAFEGHFQVVIRKETCAGCH